LLSCYFFLVHNYFGYSWYFLEARLELVNRFNYFYTLIWHWVAFTI
jgi:hypothetical protein